MAKKEKEPTKEKKPSPPKTRKGNAVWLFLIFFASGWMFVLGIFVGRGTAPVQFDIQKLQKELVELKKAVIEKEQRRYKIHRDTADEKTDLRFYEVLKAPGGDISLQTDLPEKKEPAPEKASSTKEKNNTLPEVDAAEKNKETSGMTGTDRPLLNNRTNNRETKTEIGIHHTIQVASYKDVNDADRMVNHLTQKGYAAYRTIGDIPGKGTWFRVRIGDFKDRDEAGTTLTRLKQDGLKGILVQR